jgi:hypothetical protein
MAGLAEFRDAMNRPLPRDNDEKNKK